MPAEAGVLGDNWSRDVKLTTSDITPQEGLLSALSQVAPERFPKIAIVEDTAEARRLIRRILQSQGSFTILEAGNGREGLELIQRELPDLVVLDLMMPEMDGFAVMDQLQANPETADIPVIVVTAKELTQAEKERMQGRIQKLMQKGDFLSDELMDEIRALLR